MAELSKEIMITEEQIAKRVSELAKDISREYEGKTLTAVGILKGGFIFLADLVRQLECSTTCDFIRVTMSEETEGTPRGLQYTTPIEIEGKDILIVEDILDTGITLDYLVNQLRLKNPRSLKVCTLLDKAEARKIDIEADYVGFKIPTEFVVGYGLDYQERYRELPYIAWIEGFED